MSRRKLTFWLLWIVGSAGLMAAVFWATGRMRVLFSYDFKDRLPGSLRPFGPQAGRFVKPGPEGLRITLPKDRPEREAVGVALNRPVPGDFEITVTIEIVETDEVPPGSFGAGVLMTIDETARIGRLARPKGLQVAIWDQWLFDDPKKPKFIGDSKPCSANLLRLRMKRTGSLLAYLWAPDTTGDDFELLHEGEFRADDIKEIRVMAETGQPASGVDVRFLEMRVATDPGSAPRIGWMTAATAVVIIGGLAGWRVVQARAPEAAPGKTTPGQDAATATCEVALVTCPHCQKKVKLAAKAFDKKVTCPGCAAEFVPRMPSPLGPG